MKLRDGMYLDESFARRRRLNVPLLLFIGLVLLLVIVVIWGHRLP